MNTHDPHLAMITAVANNLGCAADYRDENQSVTTRLHKASQYLQAYAEQMPTACGRAPLAAVAELMIEAMDSLEDAGFPSHDPEEEGTKVSDFMDEARDIVEKHFGKDDK